MDLTTALKVVFLGIVEGLTEFIPVSSTGHLLIAAPLVGFEDPGKVFTVVIQLGAILAVCWYYRARLWAVASTLPSDPASRRFVATVAVASVPAVIIGYPMDKWLEPYLVRPWVVANALALGGLAILWIERRSHAGRHADAMALPYAIALGVGLFQLTAILLPGISRSGATIMGALLLGVHRRAATEFSFFLAIPILLGASVLKLAKHPPALDGGLIGAIALGFVVSFVVALAVVHWLLRYVSNHDFVPFGWYRLGAGLAVALFILLGWIGA